MKPNIPSSRIEEKDVDALIATFGAKPAPEKQQEIAAMLKEQKAKFLEQERNKSRERGR
jgi:hypothetical protein